MFSRTAVNPGWGDDTFGVLLHGLVASSLGRFYAAEYDRQIAEGI
jgi:hypothetical protein